MEDLTGKQLGPYQVVAPLGEGGMAAVYKAFQPGMDRYVALKILPRQLASDPEFVGRFTQEARLIASLQHPHILPIFDFGEADGYTYIVMPFVDSGTLAGLLKGQPLPLQQVRSIVSQVGDALDYAHSRGLVHRDVKPSNVLVDARLNCLLTDFGIARMVEGTSKFTATGGVLGTPSYMSPEQGMGEKVDQRSDIYSLGVMLYEMATGRVPYQAETPIAVVIKHIHDPLPPPRTVNPALPEALERVILKSLAKRSEDRYATAGDMVRAVHQAIPDETIPVAASSTAIAGGTPPRDAPSTAPAGWRRVPMWAWIAAGAVVVVLALAGLRAVSRGGRLAPTALPAATSELAAAGVPATDRPAPTAARLPKPTAIARPTSVAAQAPADRKTIGVVLDTGGENDKSFNEHTLKGARAAAEALGYELTYVVSQSPDDYEKNAELMIGGGADLIIAAGFRMGESIERMARAHPDIHFVIIDVAYDPERYGGDLVNVTSLMFAEDEAAYPAGVLAGCMTRSNVVAAVAGVEIPPVARFVTGFQFGARSVNPDVRPLTIYLSDFNDPAAGQQAGREFIRQGADVVFGVGGETGSGALLAAHEAGVMAVGVDADQYFSFPRVRSSLLTSAVKRADVAVARAVEAFSRGELEPGIRLGTVANGGVGIAPYHDWEARIPQRCKDQVDAALEGLRTGTLTTGYPP